MLEVGVRLDDLVGGEARSARKQLRPQVLDLVELGAVAAHLAPVDDLVRLAAQIRARLMLDDVIELLFERLLASARSLPAEHARRVAEARLTMQRQVGDLVDAVVVPVGAPAVDDLIRRIRHVREGLGTVLVDLLLEHVPLQLLGRQAGRAHERIRHEIGYLAHLVLVLPHACTSHRVPEHELVRLATKIRLDVLLGEVLDHPHPSVLGKECLRRLARRVVELLGVDLIERVLVRVGRALTRVLVDDLVALALVLQVDALLNTAGVEPPNGPAVLVLDRIVVARILEGLLCLRLVVCSARERRA